MSWPPLPPWSEVVDVAWRVAFPAGGLAFAIPLAARRFVGQAAVPIAIPLGAAFGLALAFNLRAPVPWQPDDFGSGWIHVAWAAALVAGGFIAILRTQWNWLAKLVAAAAAAWVMVPGECRDGGIWFSALAATIAIPWLAVPTNSGAIKQRQWPERPAWLAMALGGLSVVALYASYLRVTDFAMMAACALAGGALVCAILGRDGRELEGLGFVTLPAMAICVWSEAGSKIPAPGYLCVGLAALPIALFRWLPTNGLRSAMIRGALVLVPAAIAVIMAMSFEELSFG